MTNLRLERWIARKFRLRHLELIADVYDCRSILKASQRLNLTQPAVTKALKDIEQTLGLELFERTNRGLIPTLYGEIFARHAKIVLAQLRHAAEELENLRVGYSGHIYVGTLVAASAKLLPDAIMMLKKDRPSIAITVVDGTYDLLLPALRTADLDLVVGRLPEAGRMHEFVYERFYSEPACLVVRRNHPLARKKRLILKNLINEPWLVPVQETALRRQLEKEFESFELPFPRNIIESMSILTNKALIRNSDCIGVLPLHVALDDQQNKLLSILPVKLKGTERPVGAICRSPGVLPPAANAFLDCLRQVAQHISES